MNRTPEVRRTVWLVQGKAAEVSRAADTISGF